MNVDLTDGAMDIPTFMSKYKTDANCNLDCSICIGTGECHVDVNDHTLYSYDFEYPDFTDPLAESLGVGPSLYHNRN